MDISVHDHRRLGSVSALVLLLPLSACGREVAHGVAHTVVDSGGVTIIESSAPAWRPGEAWKVSLQPEVVIGESDGDEKYVLSEIWGVRRLSDGRIAVLDGASKRVRIYEPDGKHLMDLGGAGDGPTEFRTPQFLGVVADTLFVYEAIGGDISWFGPDGTFLRRTTGFSQDQREAGTLLMFGHLEGGDAVARVSGGYRIRSPGLNREPWSVVRLNLSDQRVDPLFSMPGGEVMIISSDARGTHQRRYVFGKHTGVAAAGDRIYAAPTDAYSIAVHDRDGRLRRIIRRNVAPVEATQGDLDEWIERQLHDVPSNERDSRRRAAAELEFADWMPAFQWLTVDSESNVWVEEWEGVGLDQGAFSVFQPDGTWLGQVDLPEGLAELRIVSDKQLLEIGPDYVVGVWTDEFDVEQVRLYRLLKGGVDR